MECLFCDIVNRRAASHVVWEDENFLAFLDNRPLFPGHVLLVPRNHMETLADVPANLVGPMFEKTQSLTRAVESAMQAEGTFVAINNRVSQSVPHLHVHVVPRRKRDGLKGFFWPRTKYTTDDHAAQTADAIRRALS